MLACRKEKCSGTQGKIDYENDFGIQILCFGLSHFTDKTYQTKCWAFLFTPGKC